jgi:aspartyl-tRNA(Asn)/glutamyl-tRNA(Gln) amidotransferase subunit C
MPASATPQPGPTIDEAQVRHIAKLARLNLSDDEVRLFTVQLGSIVDYVRQLEEVNVDGVEPLAHPLPITDIFREDEPHEPFTPEQALANAPDRQGQFFRVPAVLDQTGGA